MCNVYIGVKLRYMKILKTIALMSIISASMTSEVFASWWNPTTWKMFRNENKTSIIQKNESPILVSTSTKSAEQEYLSCNGSKYKKCSYGQKFVCPNDGQDGYCDIDKKEEIKTPKAKESVIPVTLNKVIKDTIVTSTDKVVVKKTESPVSLNPIAVGNHSVIAENPNNATNSPTYGIGFIMPDGTKILSPLRAYGFYKEVVEAEKNGLHGKYNQRTKVFESDADAKRKDDEYQKSITLKDTVITIPLRPELPAFEIADNVIAGNGDGGTTKDTTGALHTVVCAYANGDLGIQNSEVTNWIKEKLDKSSIYTTYGAYSPAVNITKQLRPTAFDEQGMIYGKKIRSCGVITNKNGQLDYLFKDFNNSF